jgi:hypothetical protein
MEQFKYCVVDGFAFALRRKGERVIMAREEEPIIYVNGENYDHAARLAANAIGAWFHWHKAAH